MSKNSVNVSGYRYSLNGDNVEFDGPSFMCWCNQANKLPVDVAIAVILSAQFNPYPMGTGSSVLEKAYTYAVFAVRTEGGRQLEMNEIVSNGPMTREQTAACEILLAAQQSAYKNKISTLAVLRMLLCVRSHDRCNGPYDSYMRLATSTLEKY
jgi:hypothetical protein